MIQEPAEHSFDFDDCPHEIVHQRFSDERKIPRQNEFTLQLAPGAHRHIKEMPEFGIATAMRSPGENPRRFRSECATPAARRASSAYVHQGDAPRWMATAAGRAGIVRMLELLEDEIRRSLGLLGVAGFKEIDKSYVHAAAPVYAPHVLSAFNLLDLPVERY